jgi:hypothetical protein
MLLAMMRGGTAAVALTTVMTAVMVLRLPSGRGGISGRHGAGQKRRSGNQ